MSAAHPHEQCFRHEAMATWFEVRLICADPDYARQAAQEIFHQVDRLEACLSRYREDSEISQIGRLSAGESLRLSRETFHCLQRALELMPLTYGAFDPGVGRFMDDAAEAETPLAGVLELYPEDSTVICRRAPVRLDLGAMGKGYALDRAVEILENWELPQALLIAGGSSLLALAPPPERAGWEVVLTARHSLFLQHAALGASGLEVQGAHILDPRTGQAGHRYFRTWAYAPDATTADALSTAWMLLSAEEITEICQGIAGVGAAWLEKAGVDLQTSGHFPLLDRVPVVVEKEWVLLVVPCWREGGRLDNFLEGLLKELAQSGLPVLVQLVDDGSPEAEFSALQQRWVKWNQQFAFLQPLQRLERNQGKGAAIRTGWQRGLERGAAWLAFCDADGSVAAGEVVRFLRLVQQGEARAWWTSRYAESARPRWVSPWRRGLSRLFRWWVQTNLRGPLRDTQCGCKAVATAAYEPIAAQLKEARYLFDVELILALSQAGIHGREVAVTWEEKAGSKLRLWRDGWAAVVGVWKLSRAVHKNPWIRVVSSVPQPPTRQTVRW